MLLLSVCKGSDLTWFCLLTDFSCVYGAFCCIFCSGRRFENCLGFPLAKDAECQPSLCLGVGKRVAFSGRGGRHDTICPGVTIWKRQSKKGMQRESIT